MKISEAKFDETELKILLNLSEGKNLRKTAKELNLTDSQIYKITKIIKEKLKARNMTHAVYRAIKYKFI